MELVPQVRELSSYDLTKGRITYRYHAWTLVSAPHFHEGFPQLDKGTLGLVKLPTLELGGFVWSCLSTETTAEQIKESLSPVGG